MSVTTGLNQKLAQLKLSRMREVVSSLIAQAEQHQLGYAEFLDELLNEEVSVVANRPLLPRAFCEQAVQVAPRVSELFPLEEACLSGWFRN